MTTAYEAAFGGSAVATPGTAYRLRAGVRVYALDPSASINILLPAATVGGRPLCRPGHRLVVFNDDGAFNLTAKLSDGSADPQHSVGGTVIGPGECGEFTLIDDGSAIGTWFCEIHAAFSTGTPLADGRQPCLLEITSAGVNWGLRYNLQRQLGWDEVSPVAVTLKIRSGVVFGSATTSLPAIGFAPLPAGSTLLVINEGHVSGMGGAGGNGQHGSGSPAATAGAAGGPAIESHLDWALVNLGTIAGGGGGGGGGGENATANGGGAGAGGSGYLASAPGQPGAPDTGGIYGGTASGGSLTIGGWGGQGVGGSGNGGNGGLPGQAGSNGTGTGNASGGAAGAAIRYYTGTTVTKIRTGTIQGAEVAF